MTVQTEKTTINRDLSLLAIDAAEELERMRKGLATDSKSIDTLASILQESFSQNIDDTSSNYRLDYASIFSSAISISSDSTVTKKTISQIAEEAITIAYRLNPESIKCEDAELRKLISFCVALSDSAALYKKEVDDLKKHFA